MEHNRDDSLPSTMPDPEIRSGWIVANGRGSIEVLHLDDSPDSLAIRIDGDVVIRYETIKRALQCATIETRNIDRIYPPYREATRLVEAPGTITMTGT